MGTLSDLFAEIRSLYVRDFESFVTELKGSGARLVIEPTLRDARGNLSSLDEDPTPVRLDLVSHLEGRAEESLTVDTKEMVSFEAIHLDWGGLKVLLNPFQWQMCPILVEAAGTERMIGTIQDWFLRWFDRHEAEEGGLKGVVHYLSSPEISGEEVTFFVDLGSAPTEALQDLLNSVGSAKGSRLVVGAPLASSSSP